MSLDMTMANGCDTKNHHHSILFINVSNPLNYKVISSNKILYKIMYKYTNIQTIVRCNSSFGLKPFKNN